MGLSSFARRILPAASFPRLEGQDLPDATEVVEAQPVPDDRMKAQGREAKKRRSEPKPDKTPKP